MGETTVDFHLKKAIMTFDGEAMKDPSQSDLTDEDMRGKTPKQLNDMAPELTHGFLISAILVNGAVTPKDIEHSAKLQRYATKIHNRMQTDKGVWKVDDADIKDLKAMLKEAKGPLAGPKFLGALYMSLEDLEIQLKAKTTTPK